MQVRFQIIRQNPQQFPRVETYLLEVENGNTILDCLNRIKGEQDGSLAYRKNCRNTICGSCGMRINGRSTLACKENIASEIDRLRTLNQYSEGDIPTMIIAPLGNLPVIKDLVVDMTRFWDKLEEISPYVSSASRTISEREFLQSPEDRSKLDEVGNCILCGACYSECNAVTINPQFTGPHSLAKAQRLLADSRDVGTEARLKTYDDVETGVWACTRCHLCNTVCPMDVNPMDQISHIKEDILQKTPPIKESRVIRHRRTLFDLVKKGGWIDERKFALYVIGNYFRDWRGILSILPLGIRMLFRGKFPLTFHPSEGKEEVKRIIEALEKERHS